MGTRIAALLLLVTFALSAHAINDMFISQQAEPKGVIFADMHDGDQKIVDFHDEDDKKGTVGATIKPYGNNETWVVEVLLHFNKTVVSGIVDFNVKGKPSPPPVNLSVELWVDNAGVRTEGRQQRSMTFSDPSGTIAKAGFPVNAWIEIAPGL